MKLKAIIALAFGFVLATDALKADPADDAHIRQELLKALKPDAAPTPALPLGDQHVALLAQELNDVESATNLFRRCIKQNRPIVETVNAFNVLADNYHGLCAHVLQFYVWAKTENASGKLQFAFSPAGLEQLRDQSIRINTAIPDEWKEAVDTLKQKPEYARDPAMEAVGQRILASLNALQTLKDRADKQFEAMKQ
jgi:hypothetical protein